MAARFRLLLIALLTAWAVHAADPPVAKPPTPADDPVRAALLKKGYVAVPLTPGPDGDPRYRVQCSLGREKFPLLLDTGANCAVLDPALVKKLGLTEGDEVPVNTLGGVARKGDWSRRGD